MDASAIPGTSSLGIYGRTGVGSVAGVAGPFNIQMLEGSDDIAFVAIDASQRVLAVKILRSQTVPGAINGGQTVVLAASDETTLQTISVRNLPPGFTSHGPAASYDTTKGAQFPIALFSISGPPVSQYAVVPASEAQASDRYQFSASCTRLQPPPTTGNQFATITFSAAGASAVTLPLPTPLAYSPPTPAAFPSFDVSYAGFAGNPEVNYSVELYWSVAAHPFTFLSVGATAAYQNGSSTLAIPDLTGLAGFLAAPSSGTMISWRVSLFASSMSPVVSLASVENSGSYGEP